MNRPGPLQYIAYSYGRRLPDSMQEWVPTTSPITAPSAGT